MNTETFLQKCLENKCIVVAVRLYSQYNDKGSTSEKYFKGIKYTYFRLNDTLEAVGDDYWIMVDEEISKRENFFDSPQEALEHVKQYQQRHQKNQGQQ